MGLPFTVSRCVRVWERGSVLGPWVCFRMKSFVGPIDDDGDESRRCGVDSCRLALDVRPGGTNDRDESPFDVRPIKGRLDWASEHSHGKMWHTIKG